MDRDRHEPASGIRPSRLLNDNVFSMTPAPATDSDSVVRIRGLHFAYGRNRILRGIDLDIPRGRVSAILGTSGSDSGGTGTASASGT